MKNVLFYAVIASSVIACGSGKNESKHKEPVNPESGNNEVVYPINPQYVSYSESSYVECQQSAILATNCQLRNGQASIVIVKGSEPAQMHRYAIQITCSAGKSNADFGFRMRADQETSPINVTCSDSAAKTYVIDGKGDLELFVENPELLRAFKVSKNFILEIKASVADPV